MDLFFAVAFTNLGNRENKYIKCRYRFEIVGQISYYIELNQSQLAKSLVLRFPRSALSSEPVLTGLKDSYFKK